MLLHYLMLVLLHIKILTWLLNILIKLVYLQRTNQRFLATDATYRSEVFMKPLFGVFWSGCKCEVLFV
jgi:hypothetical protein